MRSDDDGDDKEEVGGGLDGGGFVEVGEGGETLNARVGMRGVDEDRVGKFSLGGIFEVVWDNMRLLGRRSAIVEGREWS